MAYFGQFKTAYLQREIPEDVAVSSDSYLQVGQLVKLTPATAVAVAYISAATSPNDATHIIAQSDVTLEYGHIPVENRDYRYFPYVYSSFKLKGKTDAESKVAAEKFVGVSATAEALKTTDPFSAAAQGSYAYVTADGKTYKKGASGWADDSANSVFASKKVALFKITNKDDVDVTVDG